MGPAWVALAWGLLLCAPLIEGVRVRQAALQPTSGVDSPVLNEGQSLFSGERLVSTCGHYATIYRYGNLALYKANGEMYWLSDIFDATGSSPFELQLQTDGNMVIYDAYGTPVWASGTYQLGAGGPYTLMLGNDGNLELTDQRSTVVWSSATPVGCNPDEIPGDWSAWGPCTVSCNGGTQTRACTKPSPFVCNGTNTQRCNTQPCAVDGNWSPWSVCSRSCGRGMTMRSCTNPPPRGGGATCQGPPAAYCSTQPCPGWSAWGPCSQPCGGGIMSRDCYKQTEADCSNGNFTQTCNTQPCTARDGGYSVWSACSKTCGGGIRTRTCTSPTPQFGGRDCTSLGPPAENCYTNPCGEAQVSLVWRDYVTDVRAGQLPQIPDFSYAGYHYQAKQIPVVPGPIFDVTLYGCQVNTYCDDAFNTAIDAAEAAKGGVIYWPPGVYWLGRPNTPVSAKSSSGRALFVIRSSNIVIRGAGVGQTEIFFHSEGGADFYRIKFQGKGLKLLGTLGAELKRGSRQLVLSDVITSKVKAGSCIVIGQANPQLTPVWLGGKDPRPEWTELLSTGPYIRVVHCIQSMQGNVATLTEPIQIDLPIISRPLDIYERSYIEEVGVEGIKVSSFWKFYRGKYCHHCSDTDDYGWMIVKFENVKNSWVRDMIFDSVTTGVHLESSNGITVQNVLMGGKAGHHSFVSSRGYGNLFIDNADSQFHGPAVQNSDCNTVVVRHVLPIGGRTDAHAKNPFVTLWDDIKGGVLSLNGGKASVMPHHGKALTLWNFKHSAEPFTRQANATYRFWPSNDESPSVMRRQVDLGGLPEGIQPATPAIKATTSNYSSSNKETTGNFFNDPIVIGLYGDQVKFEKDTVALMESNGVPVLPTSLFEAQVALRLKNIDLTAPPPPPPVVEPPAGNSVPIPTALPGVPSDVVDGAWGGWVGWGDCQGACGKGKGYRTNRRYCMAPPPKNGGKACADDHYLMEPCTVTDCKAMKWGDWSPWGVCSGKCGEKKGQRRRTRECLGGDKCNGNNHQTERCTVGLCTVCTCTQWMPEGNCLCSSRTQRFIRACTEEIGTDVTGSSNQTGRSVVADEMAGRLYYDMEKNVIRVGQFCLDANPQRGLVFSPCDPSDKQQQWEPKGHEWHQFHDTTTCIKSCPGAVPGCQMLWTTAYFTLGKCGGGNTKDILPIPRIGRTSSNGLCDNTPALKMETCQPTCST